jgi:tetratricopeptide (TPR) repeat protein
MIVSECYDIKKMRHHRHSCNYIRILLIIFYILSVSVISPSAQAASDTVDAQESHPGISKESRYAEAVIAFNKKQSAEAIKILNELLKDSPKNIEYLELKALALKGKGDEKASLELYKQLYEAKPENERGPYAFEIANILEKEKKTSEAKPYFEKSAELGFNVAASNLYIGLGAFNASRFSEAVDYFSKATDSGILEIDLIAQYYSAICFFKMNFSTRGVQELVEAKDLSEKMLKTDEKNANAKSISEASLKMLAPFSKGQWFGNAALMTQYDSNIQQLPTGSSNTASATNASTVKANLVAGIGYMTAPANDFQVVAGYRASYNKNFNTLTQGFEYFTNNVSIFVNYRALAKTSYSAKFESNLVFQNALNNPADANSGYLPQKYNFTAGGGLIVRHQLDSYWRMEAEANMRNQHYFADSSQKGKNSGISLSARRSGGGNYFNPGISLMTENNNVLGNTTYYSSYGAGFSNAMPLADQLTLNQSFDYLFSHYSRTLPIRTDSNLSFRLGAVKMLSPKISLMADITYIKNLSSIEAAYTYNRLLTSMGVAFAL